MAPKALVPFLVAMMLLTGVCNTLLTKFQDNQCVRDCDDPDPKRRARFEQPVLQTAQMFVGEAGCWLVVALMVLCRKCRSASGYEPVASADDAAADAETASVHSRTALAHPGPPKSDGGGGVLGGWRVLLLALPSICDICGTTLMNAGLLMVAASIYQMTRGALVLFVGLFSVVFLGRKLYIFQWLSLAGVVVGVALVGLAGVLFPDPHVEVHPTSRLAQDAAPEPIANDAIRAVIGVLLIAGAQIFTASQFVLEEWILERSPIEPIKVVGWEGTFGLIITVVGMVILHYTIGVTDAGRHGYFDMAEGFRQMMENRAVLVSSFLIMISIG